MTTMFTCELCGLQPSPQVCLRTARATMSPLSPLYLISAVFVGSGWLTSSLWPREAWPHLGAHEPQSHPNPPAAASPNNSGHVGTALVFESVYDRSVRGFSPTVTVAVMGEAQRAHQALAAPVPESGP